MPVGVISLSIMRACRHNWCDVVVLKCFYMVAIRFPHVFVYIMCIIQLVKKRLANDLAWSYGLKKAVSLGLTFLYNEEYRSMYLNNIPLCISSSRGDSDFITVQLDHS